MGITGKIVKSVFSKSRSFGTHDSHVERRRWASVRSYLCGDEFNSVLAQEDSASLRSSKATFSTVFVEEDSASVRCSEATVTQPMLEDLADNNGEAQNKDNEEQQQQLKEEKQNSTAKLFRKDDAAALIQSAFRSFLARRRDERLKWGNSDHKQEVVVATGSPSKESIGTSIEVQTGNSIEVFSFQEDGIALPHRTQHKGAKAQASKLKEDWDDSTVSDNISKMRIQNRLEATTRRERALAYAFSQQLRICSKKKQSRSGNGSEANMSWSWLERWMATRQQESSLVDISKQIEQLNGNQKILVRKRLLSDLSREEKESCGSNEVSMQFDSISISTATSEKDCYKPAWNRLKETSMSRRKTAPSYHFSKEHAKLSKKDCRGDERERRQRPKQAGGIQREIICEDATSQVSPNHEINNESKLGLRESERERD